MSYDTSRLESISFPVALAAATHTWRATASGHLWDIKLSPTTSFAGTTSPLLIEVGIPGDLDKYGELRAGAPGAGTVAGWPLSARLIGKPDKSGSDAAASGINAHADFQRGEAVHITVTPPVGTPAGAGLCTVVFQVDP